MAWKFLSDSPVYVQIADRIKCSVLSGEYSPGSQIPTVRQLATIAAVNPNTVQHAFTLLEDEGLIVSKGTMGRFVTLDDSIIQKCRKSHAEKLVKSFLDNMKLLSVSTDELISLIKEEKL